ncbi:hypothetical protein [Alteromonas gracilis]|uniref:hypothetical protein n=1 Tax=Alteromonas gracilis TaxID=1479524 RepID=UPI0030CE8968
MSNRYSQLKEKLPVSSLSDEVLLAFRMLYDDPLDIVDLAQDISELALYPERLEESYRKEWETYVLKAMAEELKTRTNIGSAEFIELVMKQVEDIRTQNDTYQNLLRQVHHAKSINKSENTFVFPSPLRQQLMSFLLPITTIGPSDGKK